MPSPYDYGSASGYARTRADWTDFPSTTTPITQTQLDQFDQSIYDLKRSTANVKDFAAKGDGVTDDTTAIQNAINSLPTSGGGVPANGGTVYFPSGTYICASAITVPNNVTLLGVGGLSGGGGVGGVAFAAAQLVYTGSATRFLDCRGTTGVQIRHLQIYYNNASFVGVLVDFDATAGNQIAQQMTLDHVALELGGSTKSATLMLLNKAVGGYFVRCKFAGGVFGVTGKSASGNQSNSHTFTKCVFVNQLTAHVKNANEAWNFNGCYFEPLFTAGGVSAGAGAYTQDTGHTTWGLSYFGCWFGDATQVGYWIYANGQTINALTVHGCVFGPADTHINLSGATGVGVSVMGNEFVGSFNALNVTGGNISDITFRSNYFGTGVIPLLGVPGGRSVIQYTGGAGGGTAQSASFDGTTTTTGALVKKQVALTYSATIATDASLGNTFKIVATNGTAFTISTPTNPGSGQVVTYDIKNSSGGAHGVITWGTGFLNGGAGTVGTGAFTGIANGKRRTISFYYDGTNWIEIGTRSADI